MTGPDHERWADAAGAYVLRALPEDEARVYERHLAECPACRREVDELGAAAVALPVSADPVAPPPALKQRLMADVRREAALLAAAGADADRPERPRRTGLAARLGGWWAPVLAAALLALGVLAGVALDRGTVAGEGVRTVAATVDREQAPDARVALEVKDGEGTLVAEGLPVPPGDRVYQVWVVPEGREAPEPTPTLFLPRDDGSAAAAVPRDVGGVAMVLVSAEPPGGSETPTRTPLISVAPS